VFSINNELTLISCTN